MCPTRSSARAFAAIDNIPSINKKARFCQRWIDSVDSLDCIDSADDKRQFLLNLTCFASCIEGLFFFGAFAYVYFLRSRGLLPGLASGTNWVFRDESAHMAFAYEVLRTVRQEEPELTGCAGIDQFFRAQGIGLPDRGSRRGGIRSGVLTAYTIACVVAHLQ
jgi:ribonucleotide reductase beta subunit family protein with ferritin-like domain